jgi:isopenicillin-N epimerase
VPSPNVAAFALDPSRLTLNHGSFGACLRATLARQDALRAELEADPTGFFEERYPVLLEETRARVASLVGADPAGVVFVTNATMGVGTVLSSMSASGELAPGDELCTTDHVYPACRNALAEVAQRCGGRLKIAPVPFPLADPAEVERAVLAAVGPRTRLVLLDHVTSPTGLVFPLATLVPALEARGIRVLVDGAHAPGMVPVDLRALGASYYTANLHKWIGGPKASALLWAREDRRASLRPLVVSHGRGHGLFAEFDWTGTFDPTALFAVPAAIDGLSALHPLGLTGLMDEAHQKALRAQRTLADALGIGLPAPASMIGSLVSVPLPPRAPGVAGGPGAGSLDPDRKALEAELRTRVPFFPWPDERSRLLRVSLAPYVSDDDVAQVAQWCARRFRDMRA